MNIQWKIVGLIIVCWIFGGVALGFSVAVVSGEHGSIIFAFWGLFCGVSGALCQSVGIHLRKGNRNIDRFGWIWLGISTTALFGFVLAIAVILDGGTVESVSRNIIFAITYSFLPIMIAAYLVSKIVRSRFNSLVNGDASNSTRSLP
jgi:hypothetical protein